MTTSEFCKSELNKYLGFICKEKTDIKLNILPCFGGVSEDDLFAEYGEIRIEKGIGTITANSKRALLLTVYEFLRKLGCVFLHPGKGGEVIPEKDIYSITVNADFKPANRHRGITIEGAVSLENVLQTVDWAAKVGFNSYYMQFRTAYEFFKRWYGHSSNPFIKKQEINEEISAGYVREIVKAIKQRDMIYHAVGHGWTSECLGISANGWSNSNVELKPEQKAMVAEINGERKLFKGIPLNTQLCYSKQSVREKLAQNVVNYAIEHPETDVIHFWLADDYNNACECEECSKKSFSDWYVQILNTIDEKLTEKGIKTKICFLVYFELYWRPEVERIKNEDRFIMMFAPLFRSYTKSFAKSGNSEKLVYKKNGMVYPPEPGVYLQLWKEWKEIFHGDTFDFDYHLMWDINRDFGGETLAKVIFDDVRSLKNFGMNGFMSCQLQRAFYPNGLAFFTLGRALTDGNETLESLRQSYYNAAFKNYSRFAEEVYNTLEKYVPFAYIREEVSGDEYLSLLKTGKTKIEEYLRDFPAVAESDEVVFMSLSVLKFALENVLSIVSEIILKADGADETTLAIAEEKRKEFFNKNEEKFQLFVDGFYFNMITEGIIKSQKVGIYAADK